MGHFVYDNWRPIQVDDRLLAHLQIVIIDKLRRREAFALNMRSDGVTVTMWLTHYAPHQFIYEGNRQPTINRQWVDLLAGEASFEERSSSCPNRSSCSATFRVRTRRRPNRLRCSLRSPQTRRRRLNPS